MVKQWSMVGNLIVDGEGYPIAQIQNHNHAKLIAAAPELLDALQAIVMYGPKSHLLNRAEAVIDKATS